jgi:hypothetical protein
MSLNHLEVWNQLPITDLQRQDLLKALLEENNHMPKCEQNMPECGQNRTKLAQMDEPDLIKLLNFVK